MTYHTQGLGWAPSIPTKPGQRKIMQRFDGIDPSSYDGVVSFLRKFERPAIVSIYRLGPDGSLPLDSSTAYTMNLVPGHPEQSQSDGLSEAKLRDFLRFEVGSKGHTDQDRIYEWIVQDSGNKAPGFDGMSVVGNGILLLPAEKSNEGPSPAVIVGGLALVAGALYLALRSSGSLRSNPPPGYGITYKTPYYGDALYAEDVLDFVSKNSRMPSGLDSDRFKAGTKALAQMMEASRRAEMSPGRKVADPIDVEWGRLERRRVVARPGAVWGTDPSYAKARMDERDVSVPDPMSLTGKTYGHPTVPLSRLFDKPAYMGALAPSGDYWAMKRNGRRRRRSTRLDTMSYYPPVLYTGGQGLGAAVGYTLPTNPPTPSDQVWAPPGIQYLEVDAAGNPRPEYAAITSALRIPGVGWTADDAKAGKVQLNQAKVLGPMTGDSIIKGWANAGLAVVYVASTLQAPDGFFMPIAMSNLLNNWTNQLGVYLATMPYNGPMSKAGWAPYLTPGATGTVPAKPPQGGQVTPGQVTPPGGTAIPQVPPSGTPGSQVVPGPGSWVPWVPGTSPIEGMSKDTYDLIVGTLLGLGLFSGLAVIGLYALEESRRHSAPVRARARVKDYGVRAGLKDPLLFGESEPFRGEYPVVRV